MVIKGCHLKFVTPTLALFYCSSWRHLLFLPTVRGNIKLGANEASLRARLPIAPIIFMLSFGALLCTMPIQGHFSPMLVLSCAVAWGILLLMLAIAYLSQRKRVRSVCKMLLESVVGESPHG
jgi:uncharacterized membrane protein